VPLTPPRTQTGLPALKSEVGQTPLASNHLDGLRVMVV
jgi:hypothetical protein